MEKIFLGFAFRERDQHLADQVEALLRSHGIVTVTGERLAGDALTPAIQELISDADGLIALLTRRDELLDGGWTTHEWVKDELQYARDNQKPAVALVEDGVTVAGMFAGHQHIDFDPNDPLPAFLNLSDTIGLWKERAGRTIVAQIQPEEAAQFAVRADGGVDCRYRFFQKGEYSPWQETEPIPEAAGTVLYLKGARGECAIQIEMRDPNTSWDSRVAPEWVQVRMRQRGNG